MNTKPTPDENLERNIHRVLRSLPDRAAPAKLEDRVFAEIARRAALPWWKKSFAHWPLAARAIFLVVSAAIAAVMIVTVARLLNILPRQISAVSTTSFYMTVRAYWNMAAGYCAYHLADIPAYAWMIAAGVVAASYTALFGFGAAAYRYLWKVQ